MPEPTTLIQFGGDAGSPPDGPSAEAAQGARAGRACGICGQRFSAEEARFCPFDGEPLAPFDWDPSTDPLLGPTIDNRYEVLAVIGEGGMGTVYRVRHKTLERPLALKALRADLCRDSDLPMRFIQEAKAAAAVEHPNVVQITDFGTLKTEQPYFVMELLEGQTLSSLIRAEGQLPPARAVEIATQVAEALAAAHTAGVIHRDLKPDNIQLRRLGAHDVVKVLDFGLAKIAGASRLTKVGMVFGTPHYMSPEQAAGEPCDHRVDVYALGVVMYEMLTGSLPFEADSFTGVLAQHMYKDPKSPSEITGSALGPLEDVVMRCLAKKPDERYATMGDLVTDLNRLGVMLGDHRAPLASRRPQALASSSVFARMSKTLTSRPTLVAAAVAFGLIALALAVIAVRSPSKASERAASAPAEPIAAKSEPIPATPAAIRVETPEPAKVAPAEPTEKSAPTAEHSKPSASAAKAKPAGAPSAPTQPPPARKPLPKAASGVEIINPWQ